MNATVVHMNRQPSWMNELLSAFPPQPFKQHAYYDKHLDCIRVLIRECSVCEHRLTAVMTVLEDNYPEQGQQAYVGFVIKGVEHLFETLGLPLEGVLPFIDLFDRMAALHGEELTASVLEPYQELLQVLKEIELKVDFAEAMAA
jgi:hypothetical protein